MGGQQEGHKEDDERAVGTAARHRENAEALRRTGHVDDERPILRGEYSQQPAVDGAGEGGGDAGG